MEEQKELGILTLPIPVLVQAVPIPAVQTAEVQEIEMKQTIIIQIEWKDENILYRKMECKTATRDGDYLLLTLMNDHVRAIPLGTGEILFYDAYMKAEE